MNQKIEEKKIASDSAISHIRRLYGAGAIMSFDDKNFADIDCIPTGSIGLDIAVGIGGLPRGRIVEISGPESSGKTTLGLHVIAQTQKLAGKAAIIDAEHSFDPSYAQKLGVNNDDLLISQPDNGEQALEITEILVRSGAIDLILVDSVAALTPQAEIDGKMGDSHVGLQARLMSQALRKLTASISKTKCIVIFINQIRMKIGVMFGSPETTTGGNALKFYSSVRLDIRKSTAIKDGDEVIGNETKVKVIKNKVAPPFRNTQFDIIYNQGICRTGEILTLATKFGIVDKSGSWYSYKENRLGQGKNNIRQYLLENPEIKTEIEKQIYEKAGIKYPSAKTENNTKNTKNTKNELA